MDNKGRLSNTEMHARRLKQERIKYIALDKLLADLANPDKAHKHQRIIAEFGRRFLAIWRKYQLKNGRIVTCTLARNDGYFRTAEYRVDLPLTEIDWQKMRHALAVWESERIAGLMEAAKSAEQKEKERDFARRLARAQYDQARREAIKLQKQQEAQKREAAEREVQAEIDKELAKLTPEQFASLDKKGISAIRRKVKNRLYMRHNQSKYQAAKNKYNELHREKRREYRRQYYQTHKEAIAESHRKYYQANAKEITAIQRKYQESHREARREYKRQYYQAHREEALEQARQYKAKKKQQPMENVES